MTPDQFRGVRDLIETKVRQLLATLEDGSSDRPREPGETAS
jgi:hypothetical protein